MNIAEYSIRKKTVTLVLVVLVILGGLASYSDLGRLEDPEFAIKEAVVITSYPGAAPQEVAQEVTDEIETALQQLPQLKRVVSFSKAELSVITVTIKDSYGRQELPQVWDEMRRKVRDVQSKLPPGVQPSQVHDDFGDVYGILLAVTGPGFTLKELRDYVEFLRKELLLVKDVAKIELWGLQEEAVFVEISRERLANLGIGLDAIYSTLSQQNQVVPAGSIRVGPEYIRLNPSGSYRSVEDIANLKLRDQSSNRLISLKDVATVRRGYTSPPKTILRYNGRPALSLGISIISGGNVVELGRAVKTRLAELEARTPWGIELGVVNFQADDVSRAVNGFVVNFLEAVAVVVAVLLLFMGLKSGLLIGAVLALTVLATMILMAVLGINLERISLGALIIALGMLVDNAIVVTEGMLVRIRTGLNRLQAAREVVGQNMMPLLGATCIAVLAFAAIGLSQDNTGEYCRSLFLVMLISLMMSWLIAITVTPLFCVMSLKPAPAGQGAGDPYQGRLYRVYKKILALFIRRRWAVMFLLAALLTASVYGFGLLKDSFFPPSTRAQFMVHYWLPAGTDIRRTSQDIAALEEYLLKDERIASTTSYIGAGATRFMLTFGPEQTRSKSYGLVLVSVKNYRHIDALIPELRSYLTRTFPDSQPILEKFRLGPGGAPIQVRFSGPDPAALRRLSNQAQAIMRSDPQAYAVRDNWRQRVKVIRPLFNQVLARQSGVSRPVLNEALETAFSGTRVGVYREEDELLPIMVRAPEEERVEADNLENLQVWSPVTRRAVPVAQLLSGFETAWEDPIIHRRNRKLTITTSCEPLLGVLSSDVFNNIKAGIEALELPPGYEMEWGGEYENSQNARSGLSSSMPVTVILVILILIMLFNALRQPLIILLTVPLALIGVAVGLLVFDLSFDFMALLGFLSLMGMLIKNSIVLLDQIDLEVGQGKPPYKALIEASLSRMRPVTMAAVTTVLGMVPLLQDPFFRSMAVTIMSGLSFATLLTLIVVPTMYAIFFRVPPEKA